MKSYKFEFYSDDFECLYIIRFNANLSIEQMNEILNLCKREYKIDFEEIFKWYLEPFEYANFMCSKEEISYENLLKRITKIRYNSSEMERCDYNYFVYFRYYTIFYS